MRIDMLSEEWISIMLGMQNEWNVCQCIFINFSNYYGIFHSDWIPHQLNQAKNVLKHNNRAIIWLTIKPHSLMKFEWQNHRTYLKMLVVYSTIVTTSQNVCCRWKKIKSGAYFSTLYPLKRIALMCSILTHFSYMFAPVVRFKENVRNVYL